jgi:hypothetical protein
MKLNDVFPARFVKSEDFEKGEERTLTVKNVEREEIGQDEAKEIKPIIYFREKDAKPFVCNKTNWLTIAELWGEDSDDWIGKGITLYVTKVPSFGKMVDGIRVVETRPVVARAQKQAAPTDAELFEGAGDPAPSMNLKPGGVPIPSHQR